MESKFTITRWDETATGEFDRVQVGKAFTGVLEGTSTAELTTCQPVEGSAGYVAIEKFEGRLDGREGTFVFQHAATISPAGPAFYGVIIPDSGTGELTGISGTVKMEHELITLDYTLD
ncbi:DUF3224 domain-containing protein [Actinosynnema sp. NPDC047251]|uniref:DUF3224 domain-containing protein n=1 Tax=Saccharothrix espanaensis (strain ATCC 51144 / DSM 44229 / JCM 9112 / NBRC 15066 / NRRL 15764) TaxID=1179773 RepID=K0JP34_SACES|nr:DUF3224 domain-containing protein [Saccharothrix espanaensis]CCH28190.1 hypothetical protein BN6_08610 [Saccharothrix espanaensis DSM 44229]